MRIAIASGKGGTGKTTVAVNLALTAGGPVQLLDCDVEEPNCHLFLPAEMGSPETVGLPVPEVDEEKCNACGECGRLCQYSAIVSIKTKPLTFLELCHGCGGCAKVCPTGAITEVERPIGVVESGSARGISFIYGRLNVGEPMSPPLIRAVKERLQPDGLAIIDAPPGTSCPVIATLRDTDFVVLVTEPTPFGLNDLTLAVETLRQLTVPFGVVINRADVGDRRVHDYCRTEKIDILVEIPDNRRVAEAYSRGEPAIDAVPELRQVFARLYREAMKRAARAS